MKLFSSFQPDGERKSYLLHSITRLITTLVENGVPAREVLHGSGVPEGQLENPHARVSFSQILVILENTVRLTPRADIGLVASRQARFSDFGVIGYTLISAHSMADAFELGLRYLRLVSPAVDSTISMEDNIGVIEASQIRVAPTALPICSEFWIGTIAALCEDVLKQPLRNLRLHLPYPDPGYGERYRMHFECPVVFDTATLRLEFDAANLYERAPYASSLVLNQCVQSCESILAELESEDGITHQVTAILLENPGQFPSASEVAKSLGLSVRSMGRRLSECGHSFQSVLNETRKKMALQYLQRTSLSVPEIAARVGFSDASNFRRAFKRWTKATPATFRPE